MRRNATPNRQDNHCNGGAIMTAITERITRKLTEAFAPQQLRVIDESHQHHGHGGWREGGETHFRVDIVSEAFAGKSRLERHRLVNAALAQELADRVHALAIAAKAPGEA
ncbi:BolA family transcriptional regulator OS=Bosea thiooxidans OX=53254 GN=ARD30_14575 PE=3 SV=1 [Bosea thiooxidans]